MKTRSLFILAALSIFSTTSIYAEEGNSEPIVHSTNSSHWIPAPNFVEIDRWINSEPLEINDLKGKVVLVNFWAYSCIGCIRSIPHIAQWEKKYKDQGLVVIGIHTPEFAFERHTDKLSKAIMNFNIHYPVAQDNRYATWDIYHSPIKPSIYLVDSKGHIVYTHFGEGDYTQTENAIRTLLGINDPVTVKEDKNIWIVGTPEIYVGLNRLEYLDSIQKSSSLPMNYVIPETVEPHRFALGGTWKFENEYATLVQKPGVVKLRFNAGKAFIVAHSPKPTTVSILVDGKSAGAVQIGDHDLYTLYNSDNYTSHILEMHIDEPDFQIYAFTFG